VPAQEPAQLFTLKEGAELAGLTVRLTPGAATVSGRVVPPEDVALPAKLHVYLVPAEKERADDTLRYAAAEVEANGVFGLTNVPPGRYRLVVQPAPAPAEGAPFLKSASRAQLRRAAEAANQVLDLLPCQRVSARTLPYLPR
jgi:hypothetical protein